MTQELQLEANAIRKKILTMQWDLSQGQLHAAKEAKINSFKKQLEELEAQIASAPKKVRLNNTEEPISFVNQ